MHEEGAAEGRCGFEVIVSSRYYLYVAAQSSPPQQAVAELLERLGHCACSEAFSAGLNPAQWAALRYFERANRFSRTVSAFARYHGTTRGTASQTIRALVQKGYLRRLPAKHDQRSFRLDLTEPALQALASDPLAELADAAGTLAPAQCSALIQGLRAMLERVNDKRSEPGFGVCTSCRHLESGDRSCDHRCLLQDELLEERDLGRICVDYRCGGGRTTIDRHIIADT